jgi:diaminopimelate epimerase
VSLRVLKGHGTENDFVVVPDLADELELTPDLVRALCDRHGGVGADGVLRVVRGEEPDSPFFMDYRNADGSIAEMCGNGVRVFVRYLQYAGLAAERTVVLTRGGTKYVSSEGADLAVVMGHPVVSTHSVKVTARNAVTADAIACVQMPNPHVVVLLDSQEALTELDLTGAPVVEPPLPDGQNVEFVHRLGPRHLTMRVHERGVGETRSCGTGICAVVAAIASRENGADGTTWQVDVPGGTTTVTWRADGEIELCGPAVIVGEIELDDEWLAAVTA